MTTELRRLLDGLEEMLRYWQVSAGALGALGGRQVSEGAEGLAAELLLLEVGQARDELDSPEVEAIEATVAAEKAEDVARPGVPQGRRR
jgi:hypothetical protein